MSHAQLIAQLRQQPRASEEDVQHLLAYLLVVFIPELDPDGMPREVLRGLGVVAAKAGVDDDDDGPTLTAKINGYFQKNPPNAELFKAFRRLADELVAEEGDDGDAASLAKLMGAEVFAFAHPDPADPAAGGSLKGGLGAMLHAHSSGKKKKKKR